MVLTFIFGYLNETDVNPENFILFNDSDVTGLVNWFQGLSNLDYYVDQEVLVSFLHLTSENTYHLRETQIFADVVYDSFYNNNSVVSALTRTTERYIESALQINDDQQALPSNIYVLGFAFNVTEIREDESTDDSSTSSSYSSGSGSDDQEERIAQILEYLRDDSSGYGSL